MGLVEKVAPLACLDGSAGKERPWSDKVFPNGPELEIVVFSVNGKTL